MNMSGFEPERALMKPSLAVQIAGQIAVQIEELRGTGGTELRQRYREVFGELPKTSNQYHLRRRIAWSLQARALGDISARARKLKRSRSWRAGSTEFASGGSLPTDGFPSRELS